ncbi:MAG TPA: DNA-3-methyladenine glycosylase [Tepidisphaeraceae bacterium]|jgi:DNA-3-methyladenine glycosylase
MSDRGAQRQPVYKLGRRFYQRPGEVVARELLGKILVHRLGRRMYRCRIVETEAYLGPADLASHASKGRTNRTEVMFGRAGHAYVYFIYGMYDMFNIVAGNVGDAHAILIRAGEALDGWEADLSGPGKLARAMKITRRDNALDLAGKVIYLADDGTTPRAVLASARIGIDYAQHWKDALLRFHDADSAAVSKVRRGVT